MEKKETKLKACPFCGGIDVDWNRAPIGHLHWVECGDCRAEGPVGIDKDEAIDRWNTRLDAAK